jgi:SSS family solute:Na+ symporter
LSLSGAVLPSTLPPNDFSLLTRMWFPWPAIVLWAPVMSTAWLACNHSFVQCFLATRTLADAQKALLAVGAWVVAMTALAFSAGVAMHALRPALAPDQAFIQVILTMFPAGARGLLIAALMASLLASVSGVLMASGTLASVDLFARLSGRTSSRGAARVAQLAVICAVLLLLPMVGRSRSVTAFLQHFMGDVYGIIAAWYLSGVFSRRATARAAWLGGLGGLAVSVTLDAATRINFAYVGFLSFAAATLLILWFSRWEPPPTSGQLAGLTVYAPSSGDPRDRGWAGLKWYAGAAFVVYAAATIAWELYLRK